MVTLPGLIEYEHGVPKMAEASSFAIAMPAGDALVGAQIARDAAAELSAGSPSVTEIAESLAAEFDAARLARMEQQVLSPRALDVDTYYEKHDELSPQIVAMLDNTLAQWNLGVELLVAGVDSSGGHIFTVFNPGSPANVHDSIGYAAVGSGWIHAIQAFIGFRHTAEAGYHETVFRAYAAKRRAEVAPGVGHDTDMAVISPDEGIHWLTEGELAQLDDIYNTYETSVTNELTGRLATFRLGEESDDDADERAPQDAS
jgi:hypothetical protein